MTKGVLLTAASVQKLKQRLRDLGRPPAVIPQPRNAIMWPENIEAGTGIYTAYVAEDAPQSNRVRCFLTYDGTDPGVWSEKAYIVGDVVTGDDTKIYRCILAHTGSAANKPITGTAWAACWKLIAEIVVYCDITGGGNLEDARRHLLTMHKSIGYDALILAAPPERWSKKSWAVGKVVIGTNSTKEHYACILLHTGTVDNRPSSGDDWETDWEVSKSFADELSVVPKDDCTDIGEWELRDFLEGEMIYGSGSGDEIYICDGDYTAGDDTTRPSSGANNAAHWSLLEGVYKALEGFTASFEGPASAP